MPRFALSRLHHVQLAIPPDGEEACRASPPLRPYRSLRDPTMTIAAVARRVGYGSGFALSAACTRVRGVSPSQHRVRAS